MISVPASKFKAKLGVYMRAVREGQQIIVTDRSKPVARFVPFEPEDEEELVARRRDPAAPPLGAVEVRAIHYRGPDTTGWLREDRSRR